MKRIREEETEEDKKRLTGWLSRTGTLSGGHKASLGPLLGLHNLRMHLEGRYTILEEPPTESRARVLNQC